MLRLPKSRSELVPYTVGYSFKNRKELWTTQRPTARDALALVEALQKSDKEINFIDAPGEGKIGVEMLRIVANEEGLL
jgi:hypothetical protein